MKRCRANIAGACGGWIEESREMLRLRAGIAAAAALWRNAGWARAIS
jgi:hypothetical protein